jgi:hypothetical protein
VNGSQLFVRGKMLAKASLPGIACVKLAVCAGVNPDLHLEAQARTMHSKQKQKRASPNPYFQFSSAEQRFREVEGGSNVSRS